MLRSFDSLIADLTRSLVENVTLPSGVRTVYTLDGRKVDKVDDLEDGQSYVCSGVGETFKKLDYEASAVTPQSFRLGPESVSRQSNGVSSEGNGTPLSSRVRSCEPVMRSKLVTLIRNGTKPRKVCRLLLNKRNSPTLEQALAAITDSVKLDTGCVRKVFTQSGTPVTSLLQFFQDEDVFFAYGNERVNPEDFELDFEESKAVLQFKKSITRTPRKGPSPGMPLKESAAARAVRAAARAASVENPTTLESTFSVDSPIMPPALRLKYDVGAVIGEGYFAVVRICTDTTTDQKYALKIIDRRKSKGKEHYVAAEVRVMRNLCHPRVVTLYDEFYSTDWVFLVMELVRGGDLFDSIAASIKYSEPQSRLLIGHLTSAIAYLHSLSIVHRDIKPENLLDDYDSKYNEWYDGDSA
ncbi:hypothetical protein MSG28_000304 [Choristoneura fumiferana]|uniref:Uncharacterized protein n=1 Tax=Choristoneura fumiferana TaxID=7141 RepID=A0ACC0K015_CHOFU|nr:hypothetical protein MSG28_000304 [Choristoneura fumiferana]